jgi:hypothetical protein
MLYTKIPPEYKKNSTARRTRDVIPIIKAGLILFFNFSWKFPWETNLNPK